MIENTRILFVCLGNIVRSPLAENIFRKHAERAGVGKSYQVDSAGTSVWHVGEHPDSRMRRVAAKRGLRYDGRARQFSQEDFKLFDLIIAMDMSNKLTMLNHARSKKDEKKIYLMREFEPGGGQGDVPDPYYGGIKGFEEVFDIVERSCKGLLRTLEDGSIVDS